MPDDIKTHAGKLREPYVKNTNAPAIIASARILAQLALENKNLHESHRTKMLSDVVWYCTEVDGKWKTRYKSKKVVELAEDGTSLERINHEHVLTRKDLIIEMRKLRDINPINLEELYMLLDTAVACIVTKSEHEKLAKASGSGWQRYDGIVEVYDTAEIPPKLVKLHVNPGPNSQQT